MGLLAWLATTSSPQDLSILEPASPAGASIRYLFLFVTVVTLVILLVVWGVLFYSVFRFRQRADAARIEPPQVYGSTPIEVAWTVAPTLVVFLLVLVITRTEYEVRVNPDRPPAGAKPLRVTVIGHQWWWEYVYESYGDETLGGMATANELHMPASTADTPRPLYLTLKSADVAHSYWVPRLGGKVDLIPGRTNSLWLQTDRPGLYLGQCAEYCGTQHAHMLLRVYVDRPEDFDQWLANERKEAADDPSVRAGREVFLGQSCINCHRVRGTRAQGTYAPDLTHLMSRQTLASGMVPNNRSELFRWVKNPDQVKSGCLMPAFGLSDSEFMQIVDYLETLR